MQALGHQLNTYADPEASVYDQPTNMTSGEIGPGVAPGPYRPEAGRADRLSANIPGDFTSIGSNSNGFPGTLGGANH